MNDIALQIDADKFSALSPRDQWVLFRLIKLQVDLGIEMNKNDRLRAALKRERKRRAALEKRLYGEGQA